MEWKKYRLGDLACSIQTGPFGSQLHQSDYSSNGTPVIMPKDMMDGKISESLIARVADDHVERLKRHKVKSGDVVYSRRGDVGRCALITDKEDGWLCGTGCLKVELNEQKVLPSFLFYILQRKDSVGWVENHAVGSTMPNLNTGILSKLPVMLPTLKEQQCIASILSAYDKLIENNNKRIRILEKMAENLYKEWFVRFRFPGHESVPMENGLPKGWRRVKISKSLHTCSGGTPSRSHREYYDNGEIQWVKTGEIQDSVIINTEECITELGVKKSSAKILPRNTLLLAMYGVNIGKVGILAQNMACNQAACAFLPDNENSSFCYLFYFLKSIREYLLLIGFGAAQQNLSQALIGNIRIVLPEKEVILQYESQAGKIMDCITKIKVQNSNLARQRDLLLPRLMSGKLSINVD